ncbi:MAG: DUF1009 domain-containing protein [Proteobacteria bacterium]|nr:DUF1009 domain-containing protein [Pseudomonadota bacterium]
MSKKSAPVFALLAGGGALPAILAAAAQSRGWPVHMVTFAAQPQPSPTPQAASTQQFPMGQIGHILAHLRGLNVTHVALAGHLNKPGILSLKPDAAGLKLLARAALMHDDALLRAVTLTLTENGFTVVGAKDLAPNLQAPDGLLSKSAATEAELQDIALATQALTALGNLDIGQAAIVARGVILGVEAAEGTDDLIHRCASLRGESDKGGILVKRAKPNQTDLADLPTVGPQTLHLLAQNHYRGLAVQSGRTLLLSQPELIQTANAHGMLFLAQT